MATILDNYRNLQNNYRSQIAANSLPLEDNLKMQEVNYRICVLETFESLSKSAPITMDTKVMGYHYQLVDAYVKFVLTERKFGPKTDTEGIKKRETAAASFEKVVPGADDDGYVRAIPLERLCVRLAYGAVDSAVNSGVRQAPELCDFVVDAALAGDQGHDIKGLLGAAANDAVSDRAEKRVDRVGQYDTYGAGPFAAQFLCY